MYIFHLGFWLEIVKLFLEFNILWRYKCYTFLIRIMHKMIFIVVHFYI